MIDEYLRKLALGVDNEYGQRVRQQFKDIRGSSELAMLASPSSSELAQLKKAVAIMTPNEKENAAALTDEQILRIAADAGVDAAVLAIFINGYALENSRQRTRR